MLQLEVARASNTRSHPWHLGPCCPSGNRYISARLIFLPSGSLMRSRTGRNAAPSMPSSVRDGGWVSSSTSRDASGPADSRSTAKSSRFNRSRTTSWALYQLAMSARRHT